MSPFAIAAGDAGVFGLHKNGIGGTLAATFVVATELWFAAKTRKRKIWLSFALMIMAAALLFILSRGAWMAAIAGVLVIVSLRRQFKMLLKVGLLLVPMIAVFWYFLPQEKKDYALGFGADRYNIQLRYESIDKALGWFHASPVYGLGVGLRKEYDATNVVLLTLAETGVIGLGTFVLIHIVFVGTIWKTQARLYRDEPMYSLCAVGAALVLGLFVHGVVDHYWSRGVPMLAWGAAGMAIGSWRVSRYRRKTKDVTRLD
jgi:hypothetical protein